MKSSIVILSSFLLTAIIGYATYNRKKQFYPTVVYLTNNQPCVAILLFQCAVLLFLIAKLLIRIFFGRLQQAEVDNLVSQSWYAFFDMCLVFAFFQDELGMEFMFLFSILLLVRAFHWLIEERVDYLERSPAITFLFHFRILSLIFLLAVVDAFFLRKTYLRPSTQGLSVHVALGIEYFILILNLLSVTLRYIMHSIDSMREHPWDKKTMYLLYVDIIVGIIRLAVYAEFAVVMWTLHPFPLFIVRPIYLSVRTLKKSIRDVLLSRRAIRYMNTVFNNATSADLQASSDTVCIICREEMQPPAPGAPANQSNILKKLPCSHIFHASCLRSWFQRQQTCPTCRMDIIQQARQQELQNQRQGANRGPGTDPASSGRPAASSANAAAPAGADPAARPFWMPPQGLFPPFQGWPAQPAPTSAPSQSSSSAPPAFPPVPLPLLTPPFVGMPIVYPGNLFPTSTLPMPAPPSGEPDSASESQLRASAEARFAALRQINVLLNAAVLQMNAYLNAATSPTNESGENPWLAAFAQPPTTTTEQHSLSKKGTVEATKVEDETNITEKCKSESKEDSETEQPNANHIDETAEVRKRRLERLSVSPDEKSKNE